MTPTSKTARIEKTLINFMVMVVVVRRQAVTGGGGSYNVIHVSLTCGARM